MQLERKGKKKNSKYFNDFVQVIRVLDTEYIFWINFLILFQTFYTYFLFSFQLFFGTFHDSVDVPFCNLQQPWMLYQLILGILGKYYSYTYFSKNNQFYQKIELKILLQKLLRGKRI